MRHGVQQHIDPDRVAFHRKLVEELRIVAFALVRIAEIGVVGRQDDDAAAVIDKGVGVRRAAVFALLGRLPARRRG